VPESVEGVPRGANRRDPGEALGAQVAPATGKKTKVFHRVKVLTLEDVSSGKLSLKGTASRPNERSAKLQLAWVLGHSNLSHPPIQFMVVTANRQIGVRRSTVVEDKDAKEVIDERSE